MIKLNLGCGANKIEGFTNVDIDIKLNPDESWDFKDRFPYESNSVSEVVLYHVIEHIEKSHRGHLLNEIHRVLVPGGKFTISYPEFLKCVENWKENKYGHRDFWEATIFGRQASKFDYHVCIMDTDLFTKELVSYGFHIQTVKEEPTQPFNTVVKCVKTEIETYEKALRETVGL